MFYKIKRSPNFNITFGENSEQDLHIFTPVWTDDEESLEESLEEEPVIELDISFDDKVLKCLPPKIYIDDKDLPIIPDYFSSESESESESESSLEELDASTVSLHGKKLYPIQKGEKTTRKIYAIGFFDSKSFVEKEKKDQGLTKRPSSSMF